MDRAITGRTKLVLAAAVALATVVPWLTGQQPARPGAAASVAPGSASAASTQSVFTVASYNINFRNADLKGVVETIRKSKAELVFLQETNPESEKYLRQNLSTVYPSMAFHDGPAAGGFGFMAKLPIAGLRYLPPPAGCFGAWMGQAKLGGKNVVVANVHLYPTIPNPNGGLLSLGGTFAKAEATRAQEIAAIVKALPPGMPVLMAGDFNSPPGSTAVAFLAKRGFIDSHGSAATASAPAAPTWHSRWRGVDWENRLDYIYHTDDLVALSGSVIAGDASDHYLVLSTLKWNPKPKAGPASAAAKK